MPFTFVTNPSVPFGSLFTVICLTRIFIALFIVLDVDGLFVDSGGVFSGTLYASDALTQLGSNPSGATVTVAYGKPS